MRIFYRRKGNDMGRYDRWNQLQGLRGKVVLKHLLFGTHQYRCDELKIMNNDDRIGIVVKETELFVYKQKIVEFYTSGNMCVVGDDMLEIKVIVNKL